MCPHIEDGPGNGVSTTGLCGCRDHVQCLKSTVGSESKPNVDKGHGSRELVLSLIVCKVFVCNVFLMQSVVTH